MGSDEPIDLYVDNQAARDLAYNPEHHKRTKQIDRRHASLSIFFVRELVENHILRVPYVATAENLADSSSRNRSTLSSSSPSGTAL